MSEPGVSYLRVMSNCMLTGVCAYLLCCAVYQSRLLLHPSLSAQQVSAVVSAGRLEYRRRLFVRLSEPGTTGTVYFPPELQALIVDYVQ